MKTALGNVSVEFACGRRLGQRLGLAGPARPGSPRPRASVLRAIGVFDVEAVSI